MPLSWRFGAVTDIGRSRKKNDDSAYAGPYFVMVADGMGGAAAGDVASAVAVQTMLRLDEPPPDDLLEALAGAVHRANDRLAELIEEDPTVDGMGTTVTAALFDGERIGVAHLGDSRGYLWRDGELLRITSDHTWVQSLIDDGRITEEEAKVHSHRSLLLKVLDGRHHHDPDLTLYDVQPGDRVLICSDGLSGFVDHDRIARVLSVGTADVAAQELTQLALEAGSTDNVTVVVADVVDEPTATLEPITVGAAAEAMRPPVSRRHARAQRKQPPSGKSLMVDPTVDPEELRYAPREPRRFLALRRFAVVLAVVLVAGLAALVGYQWSQQQYYVAAHGERVAIYRGVQADLPGVQLHHVYKSEDLLLTELPSFRRTQVIEGLMADDLSHAQRIVDRLLAFARTCAEQASEQASEQPTQPVTTATGPTETLMATPPRPEKSATPRQTATPRRIEAPTTTALTTSAEPRTTEATTEPLGREECAGASPVTGTPQ